jgi:hypothetical protein
MITRLDGVKACRITPFRVTSDQIRLRLRALQFGAWVTDEVLAAVPHRQYVFTVPRMLRVYFRRDRRLLGKLSQCAADSLKTLFRAATKDPAAVPGSTPRSRWRRCSTMRRPGPSSTSPRCIPS